MGSQTRKIQERLGAYDGHLQSVIHGLANNNEQAWSVQKRKQVEVVLKRLGYTLVTRSRAKKMGYELLDDAQPIAQGYYEAPIADYHDLYILECHFRLVRLRKLRTKDLANRFDPQAQALGFESWKEMMIAISEGKATVVKK